MGATPAAAVAWGAAGGIAGQGISDLGEIYGTETKTLDQVRGRDYLLAGAMGAVGGYAGYKARGPARAGPSQAEKTGVIAEQGQSIRPEAPAPAAGAAATAEVNVQSAIKPAAQARPTAPAAAPSSGAGYIGPERQLTAGNPTTRTLAEVRSLRGEVRAAAGEEYVRELYGAGSRRHYPVPPVEGSHPITGTGGRFVDAPVDTSAGGVLAGEVKTYLPWRTVGGKPVKGSVPLSAEIEQQMHKEVWLRRHVPGYDPRFITLDAPPTAELAALLQRLRIVGVHYGR